MGYKAILKIEGKKFAISRQSNKIGSALHCNIRLQHPSISKMHARIDWTDVGLVITNITNFGRTVVNDVPMKPLDAKLIKRREVILRLGELDGRLSLYREARKIARSTSKELQRIQSKLQCTKCNKNRHVKIQATFDEKRKFRLKFVLPKRDVLIKGDESLRRAVLTHALYNHFSHLSLVTDNTDE